MTSQASAQRKQRFWSLVRLFTLVLLAIWLAVTVSAVWFARDLSDFEFLGFPAGFWFASQGALMVYLALILGYALAMDRLEASYLASADAADDRGDSPVAGETR